MRRFLGHLEGSLFFPLACLLYPSAGPRPRSGMGRRIAFCAALATRGICGHPRAIYPPAKKGAKACAAGQVHFGGVKIAIGCYGNLKLRLKPRSCHRINPRINPWSNPRTNPRLNPRSNPCICHRIYTRTNTQFEPLHA